MTHGAPRIEKLERLYGLALRLYPEPFRETYSPAMRQAFRDGLADTAFPRRQMLAIVARDLATSLAKEHLAMLRDTFSRPVLVFNALVLAALATGLALALYSGWPWYRATLEAPPGGKRRVGSFRFQHLRGEFFCCNVRASWGYGAVAKW